jgi:hypothetical protein
MQDDFDDGGVGLPEDDMTGGSDLADLDAGAEGDIDLDMEIGGLSGRPSGGARSRSSSSGRRPARAPRKRAAASAKVAKSAGRKKAAARGRKGGRARKAGKKK